MSAAIGTTDVLYTEVAGANCYVNGEHGTVTAIVRDPGLRNTVRAAFVHLDSGPMLYVVLGSACGERGTWHDVRSSRRIDREEFDRLNTLDQLRRDMGWRESPTP
jgi:hypothetical protein